MQTSAGAVIDAKPPRHEATMKRRAVFGLGAYLLDGLGCSREPAKNASVGRTAGTIHIAGDSTAASFPEGDERFGWGAVLGELLTDARVDNAARSGRSSKSYIDEGLWSELEARLASGDLLLLQFGHNDEKSDAERSTSPAATFRDNLRFFIERARAKGAEPVLLTPIARRRFQGGLVEQTHGEFPEATRAVALEAKTQLIDLTLETTRLLESLGPERSATLFAPHDNTHTNRAGATAIARLVVTRLRDVGR